MDVRIGTNLCVDVFSSRISGFFDDACAGFFDDACDGFMIGLFSVSYFFSVWYLFFLSTTQASTAILARWLCHFPPFLLALSVGVLFFISFVIS